MQMKVNLARYMMVIFFVMFNFLAGCSEESKAVYKSTVETSKERTNKLIKLRLCKQRAVTDDDVKKCDLTNKV
jgi:hypothetical protein